MMELVNALFVVAWGDVLVFALIGAWAHGRCWWEYGRDSRDLAFPAEARDVVRGWACDEWYRMVLKAFLAVTALGWAAFWLIFADTLTLAFPDFMLALFFRTLTLLGVGGAVLILTLWRMQVARERQAQRPGLAKSAQRKQ